MMPRRLIVSGARHVGKTTFIKIYNQYTPSLPAFSQLVEKTPYLVDRVLHRRGTCENYKGLLLLFNGADIKSVNPLALDQNTFVVARRLYHEAVHQKFPALLCANMVHTRDEELLKMLKALGIAHIYFNDLHSEEIIRTVSKLEDLIITRRMVLHN